MRAEAQVLLERARQSIAAAELLDGSGYAGFAASRAYYALFHTAQTVLLERGQSHSSHSAVIAAFGREFAKTGILDSRFHRCLIDALDLRNASDYGIGPDVDSSKVQEIITWARQMLGAVESYLAGLAP